MANGQQKGAEYEYFFDYSDTQASWGWYMFFGVVLAVLGVAALGSLLYTSFLTALFFGSLFLVAGIALIVSIFFTSERRFARLIEGILYSIIGILIISNPAITLATLTLVLAIAWTVGGLVRTFSALFDVDEPGANKSTWSVIGGIVTFLLGVLIWVNWPAASFVIVGLFIGIDLLLLGLVTIFSGLALRGFDR